ncbi:MAG TPA: Ku protein [Gammaproteobacteria bacterium]|nr:Ku protein [Gammaproteobacteria bacterium]
MRALWEGSLVFGLVNIPIKLYSASEEKSLSFNLLHKKDNSPIRYARICKLEDKEVPYEDIVKGYEYEKGEYVILTDKDFDKAHVNTTHTIDIIEFSGEAEIDIRYFDKPYYLEPDRGANKAYALLRDAMHKSKKIAIAKFVLHNREHLGVLKSVENVLVLDKIRFLSEIRSPEDLKLPEQNLTNKQELDMALALIKQLSHPFKPEKFHDTYAEDLQNTIQIKTRGKKPSAKVKALKKTTPGDLMKVLKASLKKPTRPGKHKKVA